MTVVYSVSYDGGLCEVHCAKCGVAMDKVLPDVVSSLTLEGVSPHCMDCDAAVADSVPSALWPDHDGQAIALVVDPAHHVEFDVLLPPGWPNCKPGARPNYTVLQIGWAESLSGSPKVNKKARGKSLKKRRRAKKAKRKSPKVIGKQGTFWLGY